MKIPSKEHTTRQLLLQHAFVMCGYPPREMCPWGRKDVGARYVDPCGSVALYHIALLETDDRESAVACDNPHVEFRLSDFGRTFVAEGGLARFVEWWGDIVGDGAPLDQLMELHRTLIEKWVMEKVEDELLLQLLVDLAPGLPGPVALLREIMA